MKAAELESTYVSFRDIVVLDDVPNDISVVAVPFKPKRKKRRPQPSSTLAYPWVLPGRDVLLRLRLEALFQVAGLEPPAAKIESDSISFIGAVLRNSDML